MVRDNQPPAVLMARAGALDTKVNVPPVVTLRAYYNVQHALVDA
jgi:hypothetical protein